MIGLDIRLGRAGLACGIVEIFPRPDRQSHGTGISRNSSAPRSTMTPHAEPTPIRRPLSEVEKLRLRGLKLIEQNRRLQRELVAARAEVQRAW